MKGLARYLLELSVGIALTFGLNDCTGKRSEQINLRRYPDMVVLELKDNLKIASAQFTSS